MGDAWKIQAEVSKSVARAALVAHEDALDWPAEWGVTGMEVADHLPDEWTFEVYLDRKPEPADLERVAALFEAKPDAGTIGWKGGMLDRPHLSRARQLLAQVEG